MWEGGIYGGRSKKEEEKEIEEGKKRGKKKARSKGDKKMVGEKRREGKQSEE